jgi:hypothetical protein
MRWPVVSIVSILVMGSALAEPTQPVDDPAEWLAARGVTYLREQAQSWCCCVEVSVGTTPERALRCSEAEDASVEGAYTIAVHDVVRVVWAARAVTVLDVWTKLENLDRPPGSPPMLELRLTFARDGRTATLVDAGGDSGECPRRASTSTKDPTANFYAKWIDRLCAGRGTYRWRANRFVRASR